MTEVEKTVWLLGAGFSRPLGGPLFTDLISFRQARWVEAWVRRRGGLPAKAGDYTFDDCVKIYLQGCACDLWTNAEDCIALLDRAQPEGMTADVVQAAIGDQAGLDPKIAMKDTHDKLPLRLHEVFARFTQFLAIATCHYVPEGFDLPEAWGPYENWMETLGPHDTIISFNYDLVVETLVLVKERSCEVIKLHGSTPHHDELMGLVRANKPVTSICVPGPSKLAASRGDLAPKWKEAEAALQSAERLVVIGYSFPASDAMSLDFVLRHSQARCVDIVVGPDTPKNDDGTRIAGLFSHLGKRAANTNRYAQTFLTEGTARSKDGKFMHRSALPDPTVHSAPGRWSPNR